LPEQSHGPHEARFEIDYLTRYSYGGDVFDSMNALRVKPTVTSNQELEEFAVRVTPEAHQEHHNDYFGTEVIEFEIARPHRELVIDVRARVLSRSPRKPAECDWDLVRLKSYRETGAEYLLQTDDLPGNQTLAELDREIGTAAGPLAAMLQVAEIIPSRFEYRPGATYVDSPLTHLIDGGAGVCQDFAHLALNLLRRQGIAARYVSGYLFSGGGNADGGGGGNADGAGAESPEIESDGSGTTDHTGAESVEVDTHAWVEALLPVAGGAPRWVAIDPTNRGFASRNHVKIGHGRHYADVPPIKGVYRGQARATLNASVRMTRMSTDDSGPDARA
jgi:transglutaminase-like putative cysteine protease